jgi:hypothetical protein
MFASSKERAEGIEVISQSLGVTSRLLCGAASRNAISPAISPLWTIPIECSCPSGSGRSTARRHEEKVVGRAAEFEQMPSPSQNEAAAAEDLGATEKRPYRRIGKML